MRMTRCLGAAVWLAPYAIVSGLVSGCGSGHVDPYVEAVSEYVPIYCYRTIGDVDCHRTPIPGAERRLVNYYGPPPDDYPRPDPLPAPRLDAPPPARPSVPGAETGPTLGPAVEGGDEPTMLFPPSPTSAATATAEEGGSTASAEAVVSEKPAMSPPQPRPATATDKPPLVIEVESR